MLPWIDMAMQFRYPACYGPAISVKAKLAPAPSKSGAAMRGRVRNFMPAIAHSAFSQKESVTVNFLFSLKKRTL